MSIAPSPMVPGDCDLRGMEWMPLYGHRLFTSDFEARSSDAEFRAALRLWWVAWQQVPASSLPDDDPVLCRLAGLGRDIKAWRKIKTGALYGFILCNDGRLYHKALSNEAKEAWDRRLKERERKAAYRAKKDGPSPGTSHGTDTDVPGDGTGTGQGRGADVPVLSQWDGTADKTRQDRTGQDSTPLPPLNGNGTLRHGDGSLNRAHPSLNCVDSSGKMQVAGWYWDEVWERICVAAKINEASWRGVDLEARRWLMDGVEPDTIIAQIEYQMARVDKPIGTLKFFDQGVRERHAKRKASS